MHPSAYPASLSFPPPPRTTNVPKRSSLRSSASTSTSKPRKLRLSRTRTRQTHPTPWRLYTLPTLSIISFAVFILAIIYLNCVGVPETSSTSTTSTKRDNTLITSQSDTTTSSSSSDWSGSISGTLFAYTALLPLLTFLLTSTEFVAYLTASHRFRSNLAFIISLISSLLFLGGWTTNTSIWLHCELPLSGHNSHALGGDAGLGICPAMIKGHFMYGVREISVAKDVVSWLVVLVLLVHTAGLVDAWRKVREEAKRYRRSGFLGEEDAELGEVVVIGLESIKEVEGEEHTEAGSKGKVTRVDVLCL